MTVHFDYL